MKLGSLEVHRPVSINEALQIQAEFGDDAAFYAGGTELLLVMKLGLAEYPHLIDLKKVEPLTELLVDSDEITIGSAVTYQRLIRDQEVGHLFPAFVGMLSGIGNLRVRSTGTLGGNLAFADPHSDPLTFLMAARASVEVMAVDGTSRSVAIEDFSIAPYTTAVTPGEVLSTIRIPAPAARRFVHEHVRFRERPALTVTVAGTITHDQLEDVCLVVGAIEGVPHRIEAAERLLEQEGVSGIDRARAIVSETVQPTDDLDGSAEYKRHLAGLYAERALRSLCSRDVKD